MLVLEWLPHKECEPEIWIRMSGSLVTAIPGNGTGSIAGINKYNRS